MLNIFNAITTYSMTTLAISHIVSNSCFNMFRDLTRNSQIFGHSYMSISLYIFSEAVPLRYTKSHKECKKHSPHVLGHVSYLPSGKGK